MAGNVWEWTATQLVANYDNYANVVSNSKEGDVDRALRGGSWLGDAEDVRPAARRRGASVLRDVVTGFRVVFAPGS